MAVSKLHPGAQSNFGTGGTPPASCPVLLRLAAKCRGFHEKADCTGVVPGDVPTHNPTLWCSSRLQKRHRGLLDDRPLLRTPRHQPTRPEFPQFGNSAQPPCVCTLLQTSWGWEECLLTHPTCPGFGRLQTAVQAIRHRFAEMGWGQGSGYERPVICVLLHVFPGPFGMWPWLIHRLRDTFDPHY